MDKLIPGILIAALSAVTFFTFGWVEILCYVQFLYGDSLASRLGEVMIDARKSERITESDASACCRVC